MNSVVVPHVSPPPSSVSSSVTPLETTPGRSRAGARRQQLREHDESAALNLEVVIALARADAAELDDANPPAGPPVLGRQLLEQDDAVRDALQLEIVVGGRVIVEHQHGAVAAGRSTP